MTTLCLIDPPVISFDKLNVLLYGSDEFKNKINKEITGVAGGAHGHSIFCVTKIKKGNKGRKEFQSRNHQKAVTKVKMLLF